MMGVMSTDSQFPLDGRETRGDPIFRQVDAAAPDAAHSVIQHKLEANVTCGTELSLTVVTRDHLDNACTRGGAAVDVGVEGGERGQSVQSRVTDHKDGTYAVAFRLPEPGTWRLAVYLNNAVMECSQVRRLSLHALVCHRVEHTHVICSFAPPGQRSRRLRSTL
jgi:hypothetical protein